MYKGENSKKVLPIVIGLIVVAISIAALVSLGRALFGGGTPAEPDVSREALTNTSAGHSVRMTVRGPIVADETFRSHRVSISPSSREITTYSGYIRQKIDGQRLTNYVRSYEEFVYALGRANLAAGTAFTGGKDDTRGVCATGKVVEFEILEDETVVKRLWTSTCRGSNGSLKANSAQLQKLFMNQIPDSDDLVDKIDV